MVVLIDEEKIERMATDENYRKQYEGTIKYLQGVGWSTVKRLQAVEAGAAGVRTL